MPEKAAASVLIREMRISDYDRVYAVWQAIEGLCLEEDDSRERIILYLARNPGLCYVAVSGEDVQGTVLAGHDGRRGILRHLAVVRSQRGLGLGRRLVDAALNGLAKQGIQKCNLFVMDGNPEGMRFWEHLGFYRLEDDYRTLQGLTCPRSS